MFWPSSIVIGTAAILVVVLPPVFAATWTEMYVPYNNAFGVDSNAFGDFGRYDLHDPLRQHLHLLQAPSSSTPTTPVYFYAHANGGKASSMEEKDLDIFVNAGYSVISWESVSHLSSIQDVETCWSDFELVWSWFQDNAAIYGLDSNSVIIGGRSRGTVCSWPMAHSSKPQIKGIYMYNALPNSVWQGNSTSVWLDSITKTSPPAHLVYGPECPKPISEDCDPNDGHNPRNGQRIVNKYTELGIASEIELTDGLTKDGIGIYDLFPNSTFVVEDKQKGSRIVGGQNSAVGDFPYFVDMGNCGGALITPDTVLTAAHCGDYTGRTLIIGGTTKKTVDGDAEVRYCDKYAKHPIYKNTSHPDALYPDTEDYDYALCFLDYPILIDESRVRLEINMDDSMPTAGEDLIVMGMGDIRSGVGNPDNRLKYIIIPARDNEDCDFTTAITDQMICAGFDDGRYDSCKGDSGGPVVKRAQQSNGTFIDYHIGVASFGAACGTKPFLSARTSKVANTFIRNTICNEWNSQSPFCTGQPMYPNSLGGHCEDDESEIDVEVQTDSWFFETTWEILRRDTGEIITQRQYIFPDYTFKHKVCLQRGFCYDFIIKDSEGDGLCATQPCKEFAVKMRNEELPFATGGDFKSQDAHSFCVNRNGQRVDQLSAEDKNAPTAAPTAAPTLAPTFAPTAASTAAPTAAPTATTTATTIATTTAAPTAAPTNEPTPKPSLCAIKLSELCQVSASSMRACANCARSNEDTLLDAGCTAEEVIELCTNFAATNDTSRPTYSPTLSATPSAPPSENNRSVSAAEPQYAASGCWDSFRVSVYLWGATLTCFVALLAR